jgi:hypothetical protein
MTGPEHTRDPLPGITVFGRVDRQLRPVALYVGFVSDLVNAGILPAEWVEPSGARRTTPEGYPCSITRSWRVRAPGKAPARYADVQIKVPDFEHLDRLPASAIVREKVLEDRERRYEVERKMEGDRTSILDRIPKLAPRPVLRLVVNNPHPVAPQ